MLVLDADGGGVVVVGAAEAVLSEDAADVWCVDPSSGCNSVMTSVAPPVLTREEPSVMPPPPLDLDWFLVMEDHDLYDDVTTSVLTRESPPPDEVSEATDWSVVKAAVPFKGDRWVTAGETSGGDRLSVTAFPGRLMVWAELDRSSGVDEEKVEVAGDVSESEKKGENIKSGSDSSHSQMSEITHYYS